MRKPGQHTLSLLRSILSPASAIDHLLPGTLKIRKTLLLICQAAGTRFMIESSIHPSGDNHPFFGLLYHQGTIICSIAHSTSSWNHLSEHLYSNHGFWLSRSPRVSSRRSVWQWCRRSYRQWNPQHARQPSYGNLFSQVIFRIRSTIHHTRTFLIPSMQRCTSG